MRALLFFFLLAMALSTTVCGLLMIARPDGSLLNLPVSIHEPASFGNFLLPGILLFIAGSINFLALFFTFQKRNRGYDWAVAGGAAITVWMVMEVVLTQAINWLHVVYLAAGILTILIAWQLKGKWAV